MCWSYVINIIVLIKMVRFEPEVAVISQSLVVTVVKILIPF